MSHNLKNKNELEEIIFDGDKVYMRFINERLLLVSQGNTPLPRKYKKKSEVIDIIIEENGDSYFTFSRETNPLFIGNSGTTYSNRIQEHYYSIKNFVFDDGNLGVQFRKNPRPTNLIVNLP